jgi:two-component sensor histidine kinase
MNKIAFAMVLLLFASDTVGQKAIPFYNRFKAFHSNPSPAIQNAIENAKAMGRYDTAAAIKLFKQIIKEARAAGDDYNTGLAYYEMAEMHAANGEHNKAFGGYFNARPFFEKLGNEKELAYNYYGLGREQYHRGSFNPAANHLNYAILFASRNNLKKLEADAQEYLAVLYNEISYFDASGKALLFAALKIREQLNSSRDQAILLPKIARCYYLEKNYDSSLWYINKTLELCSELDMESIHAGAMLEKTDILLRLKQNKEAREQLNAVKSISIVFAERNLLTRYHTTAGNTLLASGAAADAAIHYGKAIQLAKKADSPNGLAIVFGRMAEAYALQNDFIKAYEYQKEYNNLYVRLFGKESLQMYESSEFLLSKKMSDDKVKYLQVENSLKQLKLQREEDTRKSLLLEKNLKDSILQKEKLLSSALERENLSKATQLTSQQQITEYLGKQSMLQKAQLRKERIIKTILIVAVIGLFALGMLVFQQYRRAKIKKEIIQKQAAELETLMKEIHHRVKNNLQIISSLLDIQSFSLTDQRAVEAIKEGRNRVHSMAILHQQLYSDGNIRGICIDDYITSITRNLFVSYNTSPEKITLETDIDNLNLDIDTVIPLGLIINELVSNSLKYAFDPTDGGQISISLKEKESCLELKVRDNGKGFPEGINISESHGFGLQLIDAFAKKLKATLDFYNDRGATVFLQIKKFRLA